MTALWCSLATAKQATFLQNILSKSSSKSYIKQCSLLKFLQILILKRWYKEMCFHVNQHPWPIKHPFINLYFKYYCLKFICLLVMTSPVFPSLDDIYCINIIFLLSLVIAMSVIGHCNEFKQLFCHYLWKNLLFYTF